MSNCLLFLVWTMEAIVGSTGLRSKKKSRKSKVRGTAFILKKATFFGGEDRYQGIDYRVKTPYQRDAIPSATGSLTLTRLPPSAGLYFTLKLNSSLLFLVGNVPFPTIFLIRRVFFNRDSFAIKSATFVSKKLKDC